MALVVTILFTAIPEAYEIRPGSVIQGIATLFAEQPNTACLATRNVRDQTGISDSVHRNVVYKTTCSAVMGRETLAAEDLNVDVVYVKLE